MRLCRHCGYFQILNSGLGKCTKSNLGALKNELACKHFVSLKYKKGGEK